MDDGTRALDDFPEYGQCWKERAVVTPQDVDVWIGLDVGKEHHYADVLDDTSLPRSSSPRQNVSTRNCVNTGQRRIGSKSTAIACVLTI